MYLQKVIINCKLAVTRLLFDIKNQAKMRKEKRYSLVLHIMQYICCIMFFVGFLQNKTIEYPSVCVCVCMFA